MISFENDYLERVHMKSVTTTYRNMQEAGYGADHFLNKQLIKLEKLLTVHMRL